MMLTSGGGGRCLASERTGAYGGKQGGGGDRKYYYVRPKTSSSATDVLSRAFSVVSTAAITEVSSILVVDGDNIEFAGCWPASDRKPAAFVRINIFMVIDCSFDGWFV